MGPGIYIHIPFCRKACTYCDFHFSTLLKYIDDVILGIITEINLRQQEWQSKEIPSIYFGGGTPGLFNPKDLEKLIEPFFKFAYPVNQCEITIEANPENITPQKIAYWNRIGFNRLSIGIQSLQDTTLKWMNRTHDRAVALKSLNIALDSGLFKSVNVDAMYGLPNLSRDSIINDIKLLALTGVQHISCYELTREPKTTFDHQVKNKLIEPVQSDEIAEQFLSISEMLEHNGFEHYEVSNYAKSGYQAIHNSLYWSGKATLGFGPSAVSYQDKTRKINIANNGLYVKKIKSRDIFYKIEELTHNDIHNEYVMTRLRLKEGLSLMDYSKKFGPGAGEILLKKIQLWNPQLYIKQDNFIKLSRAGRLLSDHLAAELFET